MWRGLTNICADDAKDRVVDDETVDEIKNNTCESVSSDFNFSKSSTSQGFPENVVADHHLI